SAAHLLHGLDYAVGAVLARRGVNEGRPGELALHLADIPRDLDVPFEHPVVGVRNPERSHIRRKLLDTLRDIATFFLDSLYVEVMHLRVVPGTLHAKRAGERAAAVGLDHRRELTV